MFTHFAHSRRCVQTFEQYSKQIYIFFSLHTYSFSMSKNRLHPSFLFFYFPFISKNFFDVIEKKKNFLADRRIQSFGVNLICCSQISFYSFYCAEFRMQFIRITCISLVFSSAVLHNSKFDKTPRIPTLFQQTSRFCIYFRFAISRR